MSVSFDTGRWARGIVEWTAGNVACLSVVFTWHIDEARTRALWWRSLGYDVRVGGPAVFAAGKHLQDVAKIGGEIADTVCRHNPMATFASRGCPVGCWFCIVPPMEGRTFTLLPDFPARPVLCDNNLSALPGDYQEHIVTRYEQEGIPLLDANSGFEPRTFDDEVYARWRRINRGPWRFAYDDQGDRPHVERVMCMLRGEPAKRKRVYVLVGNEPMAACLERINEVIAWGGEPHVQPYIKLNAPQKRPHLRFDWTHQALTDVARWANRRIWRKHPFEEYRRGRKPPVCDKQQTRISFSGVEEGQV